MQTDRSIKQRVEPPPASTNPVSSPKASSSLVGVNPFEQIYVCKSDYVALQAKLLAKSKEAAAAQRDLQQLRQAATSADPPQSVDGSLQTKVRELYSELVVKHTKSALVDKCRPGHKQE